MDSIVVVVDVLGDESPVCHLADAAIERRGEI